jgi:hypothetical protein
MNKEEIHGKKLIAIAGSDVFGKGFINVVNKEIAKYGLMAIGININEDDFHFFISNLAKSKVEVTIFMPEFQEKAAQFFKIDKFLLATVKKDDNLEFLNFDSKVDIDDLKLLEIINMLRKEYGI